MVDFLEIVPARHVLDSAGIPVEGRSFEDIYSHLANDPEKDDVRAALEKAVFAYFAALRLPASPTLYDHLILSLRPKDIIATFNWDPFLIQAVRRNGRSAGYPRILFLHGNVLQGYCQAHKMHGVRGERCYHCGRPLAPVGLLYPVLEKSYERSPAIRSAWQAVRWAFENAFMVTIFGYSAPQSDRAAIALLNEAWGGSENRSMEQFEVINIREEKGLVESWRTFIHSHHYEVHKDFYESWIANHPRRTGEAYMNQYVSAAFIRRNPVPHVDTLPKLWAWYKPLLEAERAAKDPQQDQDKAARRNVTP